ncbi:hypothetical protein GCM10027162_71420 [Streptomyces incanus]
MGDWGHERVSVRRRMPVALTLPCAPTLGTEILTGGIHVGSQNGDSAEAPRAREMPARPGGR